MSNQDKQKGNSEKFHWKKKKNPSGYRGWGGVILWELPE